MPTLHTAVLCFPLLLPPFAGKAKAEAERLAAIRAQLLAQAADKGLAIGGDESHSAAADGDDDAAAERRPKRVVYGSKKKGPARKRSDGGAEAEAAGDEDGGDGGTAEGEPAAAAAAQQQEASVSAVQTLPEQPEPDAADDWEAVSAVRMRCLIVTCCMLSQTCMHTTEHLSRHCHYTRLAWCVE
jgi:hypothetical protein